MVSKEQKEVLNQQLQTITDNLISVLLFVQETNEKEQFDYVTQPSIGNKLDHITSLIGRISRIFNQE